MSLARSVGKSKVVEGGEKSAGDEGELRRMGLSSRKTSGLMSGPMRRPGKGARATWRVPSAMSMLEVRWARVGETAMVPH